MKNLNQIFFCIALSLICNTYGNRLTSHQFLLAAELSSAQLGWVRCTINQSKAKSANTRSVIMGRECGAKNATKWQSTGIDGADKWKKKGQRKYETVWRKSYMTICMYVGWSTWTCTSTCLPIVFVFIMVCIPVTVGVEWYCNFVAIYIIRFIIYIVSASLKINNSKNKIDRITICGDYVSYDSIRIFNLLILRKLNYKND